MPMRCVAPLVINEINSLGQGYNRPTGCTLDLFIYCLTQLSGGDIYIYICYLLHRELHVSALFIDHLQVGLLTKFFI